MMHSFFLHILQKRSGYCQKCGLILYVWPMFGKNLLENLKILSKGTRLVVERQQQVVGGKIDSWNWVGTMYGTESAMFHKIKMLILKAGIDFVLGASLLTSRESIPRRNWFSQGMDYVESMPNVHKSLKIRAHRALPLVKAESIEWFTED
jgi:hypothetical protein